MDEKTNLNFTSNLAARWLTMRQAEKRTKQSVQDGYMPHFPDRILYDLENEACFRQRQLVIQPLVMMDGTRYSFFNLLL